MRLWDRDVGLLGEFRRSPMLCNQAGRLCKFPTRKKIAERLYQLHQAGYVNRIQFFQAGQQGRAEYVYFVGRCPAHQLLRHTVTLVEVRIQTALSFSPGREFQAEFLYGHELAVLCKSVAPANAIRPSIRPDAAIVVRRGEKTALILVEADCGTERLTSPTAYSLLVKLRSYASYFDSEQYQKDFSWAGVLRGFRVALVFLSQSRLMNMQRLLREEGFDFVLLATINDITRNGLHAPIWQSHTGLATDIFGRSHG